MYDGLRNSSAGKLSPSLEFISLLSKPRYPVGVSEIIIQRFVLGITTLTPVTFL